MRLISLFIEFTIDITFEIEEGTRTAIFARFENVPEEDLEELANQVFEVFNRIADDKEGAIDMDRMQNVIQRDILKVKLY